MVDAERIDARIEALDDYVATIRELMKPGLDSYLSDTSVQLQIERSLQLAIQICIDIGAHVISEKGLGSPGEYREVFEVIGDAGLINDALAERLMSAAGTRNLLVHGYAKINRERIWQDLEHIDDFIEFARAIRSSAGK